jgi:membrane-associated PAP2 superfamily phosphatase
MNDNSVHALVRAVRGPVMLMTLGGIMAIDHFGPYNFGRTWPVLLIVLGFFKLLERMAARQSASAEGR